MNMLKYERSMEEKINLDKPSILDLLNMTSFNFSLNKSFYFLTKIKEDVEFTDVSQWLLLRGLQRINGYFGVIPDFE